MREAFSDFGVWLLAETGAQKAAHVINRHFRFFLEIDKQWKGLPDYRELVSHFGAEGLRRHRLPMRWMAVAHGVIADVAAREENSEQKRIAVLLASVAPDTPAGKTLHLYHLKMEAKVDSGEIKLRSARLALRPAAALLSFACRSGHQLPEQLSVDEYLLNSPGQKSALTGFVNFLNSECGLDLVARVEARRVARARKKKLEAELLLLFGGRRTANSEQQWVSAALTYFHDMPPRVAAVVSNQTRPKPLEGGLAAEWEGKFYWIPIPPWPQST
jgi:hypothetical protein